MTDPAYQPQPDAKEAAHRKTAAEQGAPSMRGPDELHDVELSDETAEKALNEIEKVRQKLEPNG